MMVELLTEEFLMPGVDSGAYVGRGSALAAAFAFFPFACATLAPTVATAETGTHEITVTITHVKALDKFDQFSKGDFYGRVTIGGATQSTPVISGQTEAKPNWKISKKVPSGVQKVKVEILDKDVAVDDPIDINKVDKKRDLDFTVDTRRCRIGGFSSTYRCGASISRAGKEKKAADVTFTVDVK